MKFCRHRPVAPLNSYVDWFWYYEDLAVAHDREHVLPEGTIELMFNLDTRPRRLYQIGNSKQEQAYRRGWISGAQSNYLVIDALAGSSMIGIHFRPGGARPFLGVPADAVTGSVLELDDLWGSGIWSWRDQLLEAEGHAEQFRILEQLLLDRMSRNGNSRTEHDPIRHVVNAFMANPQASRIRDVPRKLGMSHKHFINRFKQNVGTTPKVFCRIQRFQQVLALIQQHRKVEWAAVAYDCGYFDQAHFNKDFLDFAGVIPTEYASRLMPGEPNYVPAAAEG